MTAADIPNSRATLREEMAGGGKIHISGRLPSHDGESGVRTLSTSGLDKVIVYEPEEMILIVEAGVPLAEINALLQQNGQWLPSLLPTERTESTIGAAIARCGHHPREKLHSPLRDIVLGGEFLTSDNVLFKSGSRVVKSVAGYDIHRAFAGSLGLLGLIVSLTLKVSPRPEVRRWFRCSTRPENCVAIADGHEYLCEMAGFEEDVISDIERHSLEDEVSESEWAPPAKAVVEARMHSKSELLSQPMFCALKSAFDPEGRLV